MEKHCLLVINPIGGLANRMRTLAGGLALAQRIGVDYKIVWLKNWELNAAFDDIFRLDVIPAVKFSYPGKVKYGLSYSIPRLKNLYLTSCTLKRFGVAFLDGMEVYRKLAEREDEGKGIRSLFENGFSRCKKCLLQGGINVYPYGNDMYRQLFKPVAEIADDVAGRLRMIGPSPIGVHIRRTDNVQSIQNSPDEVFLREMERILHMQPETRFYLATDSEEVKLRFGREFGDRVYSSERIANRNTLAGIKEAATEMYTLAGTKAIIGSYYSSFSEAAAILGDIPLRQLRTC